MSDAGLPAMVAMLVIVCCFVVGALTNRRFGHPTFFSPGQAKSPTPIQPSIQGQLQQQKGPRRRDGSSSSFSSAAVVVAATTAATTDCTSGTAGFADLPAAEVVKHISSFLSPADLVAVAPVCSDFRRASHFDPLWKAHCVRAFGKEAEAGGQTWCAVKQPRRRRCLGACEARRRAPFAARNVATSATTAVVAPAVREHCTHSSSRGKQQFQTPSLPASPLGSLSSPSSSSNAVARFLDGPPNGDNSHYDRERPHSAALHGGHRDHRDQKTKKAVKPATPRDNVSTNRGPTSNNSTPYRPSSSACSCSPSWRDAFFYAHQARPRELLESAWASSKCVIMVHRKVHDLTDFLPSHPGGALILREHASTDATHAFERFFHSREARRIARGFMVWDGLEVMGRKGTLWKVVHGDQAY